MKKRTSPIPRVIFLGFCAYATLTIVGLGLKINTTNQEISALKQEKQALISKVNQIEKSKTIDDESLSNIARTKLGYASEGERIFIDTSSK